MHYKLPQRTFKNLDKNKTDSSADSQSKASHRKQATEAAGVKLRPSEELADLAEGIWACFMQSSGSSSKLLRAFNWFTISENRSQSRQR